MTTIFDLKNMRPSLAILDTLTPREETVIKMALGIGRQRWDNAAIAKHFDVTEERLQQIISKAVRKLNLQGGAV